MKLRYWLIIIFSFFIVMFLVGKCSNALGLGGSYEPVSEHDKRLRKQKGLAPLNAQLLVKGKLKSPSSAEFPPTSEAEVQVTKDTTFLVSSYVDSENGFGAMIRKQWVAEIKYLDGDKVQLINVAFLD